LVDGDIGAEMGIDEERLWSDLPTPLKDILLWAAASGCSTRLLSLVSKSCVQFFRRFLSSQFAESLIPTFKTTLLMHRK